MKRLSARLALALSIVLLLLTVGCGPPTMGAAPEAMKEVDALYTAVSLRDAKLVAACRARLGALHASGKLPDAAHDRLEAIGKEAEAGGWDPAIGRLNDFMLGQRR